MRVPCGSILLGGCPLVEGPINMHAARRATPFLAVQCSGRPCLGCRAEMHGRDLAQPACPSCSPRLDHRNYRTDPKPCVHVPELFECACGVAIQTRACVVCGPPNCCCSSSSPSCRFAAGTTTSGTGTDGCHLNPADSVAGHLSRLRRGGRPSLLRVWRFGCFMWTGRFSQLCVCGKHVYGPASSCTCHHAVHVAAPTAL